MVLLFKKVFLDLYLCVSVKGVIGLPVSVIGIPGWYIHVPGSILVVIGILDRVFFVFMGVLAMFCVSLCY